LDNIDEDAHNIFYTISSGSKNEYNVDILLDKNVDSFFPENHQTSTVFYNKQDLDFNFCNTKTSLSEDYNQKMREYVNNSKKSKSMIEFCYDLFKKLGMPVVEKYKIVFTVKALPEEFTPTTIDELIKYLLEARYEEIQKYPQEQYNPGYETFIKNGIRKNYILWNTLSILGIASGITLLVSQGHPNMQLDFQSRYIHDHYKLLSSISGSLLIIACTISLIGVSCFSPMKEIKAQKDHFSCIPSCFRHG